MEVHISDGFGIRQMSNASAGRQPAEHFPPGFTKRTWVIVPAWTIRHNYIGVGLLIGLRQQLDLAFVSCWPFGCWQLMLGCCLLVVVFEQILFICAIVLFLHYRHSCYVFVISPPSAFMFASRVSVLFLVGVPIIILLCI